MKASKEAALAVLSAVLAASSAVAQGRPADGDTDYDFFKFMQTEAAVASTRPEPLFKTVSTVSVIDRPMIEAYNFLTVSEAVSVAAGLYMTRTTFMNTVPAGRGVLPSHYANKVLIMIDGIPSWLSTTGEGFLDRVHINDVERIEVLKGPSSVLYGSNAFSGAINIVLRRPRGAREKVRLHGEFGVPAAYQAGGNYQSREAGRSFFVAANAAGERGRRVSFTDETGVSRGVDDLRYPRGGNFTLAGAYRGHSVLFNGYQDEFLDLEGAVPQFAQGAGRLQKRSGYLANYSLDAPLTDALDLGWSATYDWNERDFPRTQDETEATRTSGYRIHNLVKIDARPSPALELEGGADYDYRWVDFYKTYDPRSGAVISGTNLHGRQVFEYSAFAQLGLDKDRWKGAVGSRLTRNQYFGTNVASRGTLIYLIDEDNSVKLIAGQSYRSPSIFELFFLNPTRSVAGNPRLQPERSDSAEVAYLAQRSRASLQAVAYIAQYKNKIDRVTKDVLFDDGVFVPGVRKYENGGKFNAVGAELEARYRRPEDLDAFAAVTYVRSRDGWETNFRFVPKIAFAAGAAKTWGPVTFSGVVRYRGATAGRLAAVSRQSSGDLSAAYERPKSRIRHVLAVKNVANRLTYFPEYVRQTGPFLNELPSNDYRSIVYSAQVRF
ncbi:MAG: TonB-dependent receptor [Elusimicrobia bacterium]|nr:TonB-dependent receptor [Elusimicrobiota bacterium]